MKKYFFLLFAVASLFSCGEKKNEIKLCDKTEIKKEQTITAFLTVSQNGNLTIDEIEYFTGSEAVKEYKKDNENDPHESTYYIRNNKVDSVEYEISDSIKITTKTFQLTNKNDLQDLLNAIKTKEYITKLPFRLFIKGNKLIRIEEIYIP